MVSTYLAFISDVFEDEGFRPLPDRARSVSGQRRQRVEDYYAGIDWDSEEQVAGVFRVFGHVLAHLGRDSVQGLELQRLLTLDGISVDISGRLVQMSETRIPEGALSNLKERAVIDQHLARIAESMDRDPEQAIGAAKELVESTAKLVLATLGRDIQPGADMTELTRAAQKSLALHPDVLAPSNKGSATAKKILGALSALSLGVVELRNLYGTGHGRERRASGLKPRHVHLAVGAATLYCRMLLETLEDETAPWRRQAEDDADLEQGA